MYNIKNYFEDIHKIPGQARDDSPLFNISDLILSP